VHKIKNIFIYLYSVTEENPNSNRYDVENCMKMEKAKIFAAHLVTSCGAPFENHCSIRRNMGLERVLKLVTAQEGER
jgi:hypothetical protein